VRPRFVVPAATERRYVPDEVLVFLANVPPGRALDRMDRELRLTLLASQRIALVNGTIRRYRLPQGASVAAMVRALSRRGDVVAGAQPNFLYALAGDDAPPAPVQETAGEPPAQTAAPVQETNGEPPAQSVAPVDATAVSPPGQAAPPVQETTGEPPGQAGAPVEATDVAPPAQAAPPAPAQYAITALKLDEAHRLAQGQGVIIAVIDSGIDESHPEIAGAIADRFDAVGGTFTPHAHGTAMAGAIVAHRMLVGAAPQARILAIRAFDDVPGAGAQGTGFNILRGLDFATSHGAQIVNMSFAGPEDALLGRALEEARRRGVIEIAAAGNAGPASPPLYPAAEPGVLAVTALDIHNTPYSLANHGAYIALSAPGVDVIALAPGGMVSLTSGTSIATAEASGVAALLIERARKTGPDDMGRILRETAHRLDVDPTIGGAGLIDALAALQALPH
jgi:subtilisin family serine protease